MNRNRKGRFHINRDFINSCFNNEIKGKQLQEFLSNFIIVRAETLFAMDAVEYDAYSELFDEVPQNIATPIYKVVINSRVINENDSLIKEVYNISVERVK